MVDDQGECKWLYDKFNINISDLSGRHLKNALKVVVGAEAVDKEGEAKAKVERDKVETTDQRETIGVVATNRRHRKKFFHYRKLDECHSSVAITIFA